MTATANIDFRQRNSKISVCLPAVNEQATIALALHPLIEMLHEGLVDQVAVVDESTDETADIALSMGAEIYRQSELLPELGRVQGKGDAMFRALTILTGDIIVYLDADTKSMTPHYVFGLCEPILHDEADMVKGYYKRPLDSDSDGGGRLNHLLARPLIRAYFPELSWVKQPLAGELAVTRELAHRLPFDAKWPMLGLTLDAHTVGARIAQVDLGVHEHRHWPLAKLADRTDELVTAVLARGGNPVLAELPRVRGPLWRYQQLARQLEPPAA